MAQKNTTKFAVATVIALATLLPAWGQNSPSATTALTYTIQGARVGIEPDGSTWTTELWIMNTWGGDWNAITVTTLDADGKRFQSTWTFASGWTISGNQMHGGPFGNAAMRAVLSGNLGTAAAQSFNIQLQTTGGFAISAIVKHLDANGKLLAQPVALTDPTLLSPALGTQFAMGFDAGTGPDSAITFSNPSVFAVNATVQAYSPDGTSSPNRTPFATVQVVIPPQGRVSRLVSELFANSADFANFIVPYASVGGLAQGFLRVTLDQPGALGVVQERINPDGSIVSTVWHAFPATSPAPPQQ